MKGSDRTRRQCAVIVSAAVVAAGVLGAAGCVSAPERATATPGTNAFASPSFCDPIRRVAMGAWTERGARTQVAADLAAARAAAPAGVQGPLDVLIELEGTGVHPGMASAPAPSTGEAGSMRTGIGRWFDAMSTLSDVADRECDVDLLVAPESGSLPPLTLSAGEPTPGTTPDGGAALSVADVVEMVRSGRPDADWIDETLIGSVATGDAVQVSVVDVPDAPTAMRICADLLAVLPERTDPATVTVRDTVGLVVVVGDAEGCVEVEGP